MNLNRSLTAAIVIGAATVILAAGFAYSIVRPTTYESRATLVLTPTPEDPSDVPGVLDSFLRSGTAGTYVELLASDDTKRRAGSPPVTITVRAIPDTRALSVTASSEDKGVVQPGLSSIVSTAEREQETLRDVWDLKVLQAPSAPTRAGTSSSVILIATFLLALLGAMAALTVLRRVGMAGGGGGPRMGPPRRSDGVNAEELLSREGSRYPASR